MTTQFCRANQLRSCFTVAAIAGLLGFAGVAHANLVSDPDFALPSASSPWTPSGVAVVDDSTDTNSATDAALGTGDLSYTLETLPGATYSISFLLAADPITIENAFALTDATVDLYFGADDLTVADHGGPIDAINDYAFSGAIAYQYLNWPSGTDLPYTDTAASDSTVLSFSGVNPVGGSAPSGPGTWYVTDVDVECTANCGVTAVPEPPAILTLFTALVATFGLVWMRRPFGKAGPGEV